MIYITGDKHANFEEVLNFCYVNKTSLDDTLIVLGDAGINNYVNENNYKLDTKIYKLKRK